MKQARIVEYPTTNKNSTGVWFALVTLDGQTLQHAFARGGDRSAGKRAVIPANHAEAIAQLRAWADANGWTVVE